MAWIGCVHCEKSRRDFVAWTFALIAIVHPILHRVSCIYEMIPNAPKHYTTHPNMSSGSNGADWVRSLRKIRTWLRGTNFFMNCTSSHRFAPSFMQLQNHNKCTQTHETYENMSLGSNGLDWVRSLRKIPTWLRGMNFALIAPVHPVLHRVSCSYKTIPNAPKH